STRGSYARTFPAVFPVLSMDRIYYRGLDVVHCQRLHDQPWDRLSDHTPLLAEFKLA
ncbi:MAG: EEP domain-containing protein, partial [Gammaproteobacteria bacterium]|nr:EEP domain-containing protein [Gammaproteobacteria bacterium]